MRIAFGLTMAGLVLWPDVATAQAGVDWNAARECLVQEVQQVPCQTDALPFVVLLGSEQPQATRHRALTELEDIAISASDLRVQMRATRLISSAAVRASFEPIDTLDRLERIYWLSSTDPNVKLLIIRTLPAHANEAGAAHLLGQVVSGADSTQESERVLGTSALNGLSGMGSVGRNVLVDLAQQESTDPYFKRHLARLEMNDWEPLGSDQIRP